MLTLIVMLPFLSGILKQLTKTDHWFKDFDAVMCAGQAVLAGLSPYVGGFTCVSAQPQAFVYTPIAAKAFAQFQAMFGLTFEIAFCGGLICLVIYGIFRQLFRNDQYLAGRAPLMAGLSASALTSGNISIGIHGLIFLASRFLFRYPALLIPVVVVASIIKPTFVVYLALFLFAGGPFRQRLTLLIVACVLIIAYFIQFYALDGANFTNWVQTMQSVGMVAERGLGFMGLPLINTLDDPALVAFFYIGFAMVIVASGVLIAETRLTDQRDRFALGISICVLLYPRLMAYDEYTLSFGLAAALCSCERIGLWRTKQLVPMLAPVCLIFAVTGGQLGGRLMFELMCLLLVGMAGALVAEAARSGASWFDRGIVRPVSGTAGVES
jgi:hypothetical protein